MQIEIVNPSPVLPMRLCTEDRKTEEDFASEAEASRAVRPANSVMSEAERAEYVARGEDIVFGKNGAGHDIQVERWQANGFSSLSQYVTARFAETLRHSYQAPARKGTRVLDTWRDPIPVATLAPGAKTQMTLTHNRRILASCDSPTEVGLRVENTDLRQTIRLRSRHVKTGAQEHVAFLVHGDNCGAVSLSKSTAGIIELMPA